MKNHKSNIIKLIFYVANDTKTPTGLVTWKGKKILKQDLNFHQQLPEMLPSRTHMIQPVPQLQDLHRKISENKFC